MDRHFKLGLQIWGCVISFFVVSMQYELMRTIYMAVMAFSVLCVVIISAWYFIFNSWFKPLIDRKNRV